MLNYYFNCVYIYFNNNLIKYCNFETFKLYQITNKKTEMPLFSFAVQKLEGDEYASSLSRQITVLIAYEQRF